MHECFECGNYCDCDGEDMDQDQPPDCDCRHESLENDDEW